jgi:hypothetical protein
VSKSSPSAENTLMSSPPPSPSIVLAGLCALGVAVGRDATGASSRATGTSEDRVVRLPSLALSLGLVLDSVDVGTAAARTAPVCVGGVLSR